MLLMHNKHLLAGNQIYITFVFRWISSVIQADYTAGTMEFRALQSQSAQGKDHTLDVLVTGISCCV